MAQTEQKTVGLAAFQAEGLTEVDPYLLAEGFQLIGAEKQAHFRQAFRQHWRAVLWSMGLSVALIMDGYDGAVSNAYFGLPSFLDYFGHDALVKGKIVKKIDVNWQTGLQLCGLPGGFLGLYICGWAQERYGSRKTYMGGMAFAFCCVPLFAFAQNLPMLLVAEAVSAIAWGIFNTLSASYAAEVCPIQLRGYAMGFISFCWGSGSFIASGVNRAALDVQSQWGWRMGYCVQWLWPCLLLPLAYFAPESPYWLVRQGRVDEAKQVLTRVARPGYWDSRNIDAYVAVIKHTDDIERTEAKSSSFWEMWRGTNRRRTLIVMGVFGCVPVFSGTAMTAYAVQFFEAAGMKTKTAFNFNLGIASLNLVGCFLEFFIIRRLGRRPLMIAGLVILGLMLLLIGIFGCIPETKATRNGIGACCAVINLVYHASVGPLTYTFAPEIPATMLRVRTVAWGRAFYNIVYNATAQLTPRMVSDTAWNWGPKAAFFWLAFNVTVTIWCYFCLPETRNLSYAELDILFGNKISARKFSHVRVQDEAAAGDGKFVPTEIEYADGDQKNAEQLDEKARPTYELS
ncbi:trehalose transport-related protein [Kockovaella imperatae]|uniref:Trehalose transport-related protein n=1 Tax=Kockovaella imperatae TaxID=4999 RepID=A0A1Y1UI14_9TREE|nr:trehalose transport-related protein [Kockovaella imperatae]ORX36725.1 trehalose transport-related protein [Kockovaella imperatae]